MVDDIFLLAKLFSSLVFLLDCHYVEECKTLFFNNEVLLGKSWVDTSPNFHDVEAVADDLSTALKTLDKLSNVQNFVFFFSFHFLQWTL